VVEGGGMRGLWREEREFDSVSIANLNDKMM
jgi:hypothetical protein